MARVEEQWIVRKGKEWLMSSRPDLLTLPHAHIFSLYVYDSRRFSNRSDAKRTARKIGGTVWKFIPATGRYEEWLPKIPKGAKCDTCAGYTPYNGVCRNPESEYYKEPVGMNDLCDEWREKA